MIAVAVAVGVIMSAAVIVIPARQRTVAPAATKTVKENTAQESSEQIAEKLWMLCSPQCADAYVAPWKNIAAELHEGLRLALASPAILTMAGKASSAHNYAECLKTLLRSALGRPLHRLMADIRGLAVAALPADALGQIAAKDDKKESMEPTLAKTLPREVGEPLVYEALVL